MAMQIKIKKFLVKCKKPFSCLSKITKKHKKESITPSTVTTTTTINTTKEEIIATTKEIKVNAIQENAKFTIPERKPQHHFISSKEIKPQQQQQQQQQQPQSQQHQQHQQQLHSISTTKNTYRYSINNIFNKSKFTPLISAVAPSFVHPVAIKLNVGGTIYMTTQQTLCTYPSYLSELFFLFRAPNSPPSSTYSQYPWPEELFIDRDGELFIHILSFLRNGTLPYSIPLSTLQKLEYEARFYGIKPLQILISHRIQIHTSSPKFKVIPIERLSNEERDYEDGGENVEIDAIASAGVGLTRSNLSAYSAYSLPQHRAMSDNMSLYSTSSSSSSGDSSEVVPIIYNPCNTTLNSCNTATSNTNYTTPITRTPKSSTSTANYDAQNNYYLSSAAAPNCNYKPDYEIISITKIPVILNNNNYNFDNFDQINYEDFHAKELATFVVLQRKDN